MKKYKSSPEQRNYIELLSVVKKLESMRKTSEIHDKMFMDAEIALATYAMIYEDKIWN